MSSTNTGTNTGSSAASGVKGIAAAIHGAGEQLRGTFNSGVDAAFNDKEGVAKNEAVTQQGRNEVQTGEPGCGQGLGANPASGEGRRL
ncbi:hypothetical protein SAICODRAFT_174024 [Saitoella complicata NRRL Y-17804]|uniref:uncharacterized protein n=1 Tax=Saitoella complicata (strain BCRC 22490 / CBS 7301 / JCM 7358 / NBRC 10748 / NRRL Y-17804) TaxID=698492 RepID=UPI0008679226|nr:uncharacterized protein SAICODRAFT_174024 [Saitoella complicata NRRL Y-17804]ODQ50227.1 hypothetical protein SAICODRAFT_174024 [Saitoella complicata NRRL Y-17804]